MAPSVKGSQTIIGVIVDYEENMTLYIYDGTKSQFLIFPQTWIHTQKVILASA